MYLKKAEFEGRNWIRVASGAHFVKWFP